MTEKRNIKRYIEITSANRDRTRYPDPAQFMIELVLTNSRNSSNNAKDPVYNSVVKYPPPNAKESYTNYGYMYGGDNSAFGVANPSVVGVIPTSGYINGVYNVFPLFPPGTTADKHENGFIGNVLELVEHVVGGVTVAENEYREIIDYRLVPYIVQYVNTTVNSAQPVFTTSVPLASAFTGTIDNYFVGWTFRILSTGETRTVTYYRAYDRRVFLDNPITTAIPNNAPCALYLPMYEVTLSSPFSVGALPITNISSTDYTTYRIRSGINLPLAEGTLVAGTQSTFTLPVSVGSLDYTGSMLWITSDPVIYTGAMASTGFVNVGGVQVQGTFVLDAGASVFANGFLEGMELEVTSGVYSGFVYRITAWDNATLTGTITPGWTSTVAGPNTSPVGGTTYRIVQASPSSYHRIFSYNPTTRVGTVSHPFTYTNQQGIETRYALSASDTFEILQFKGDNYQPLDYAESTVAQQQPHCYEIELVSLTLPNVPILSGLGGVIAYYPYVYVEFRNVSYGTSAYDLNTNNPAAKNVMFKAPIVYNYQLSEMAFIVADGHGMKQTLKFKPSDALQFSVYLPNGELFKTESDYFSPSDTNPLLQITACFSLRRLENAEKDCFSK